mmetsp:Transcript_34562/g.39996  ORF Transcript_34562/g.39996 Transcript_34562/m.39996 type:complete len:95 (-) Transcript_34562:334-618(-)
MLLQIHSDASFTNKTNAPSTTAGHFFLGKKTTTFKTNTIKWPNSYIVQNPKKIRCISSRSRTSRIIPQHKGSHQTENIIGRNVTSPTPNPHPYQ